MFTSKDQKIADEDSSNFNNLIGKGTTIVGNFESQGNVRIDGQFIGKVKSKSKIVLGQSSQVEGEISTPKAEIDGEVKGKIKISELLTLKPSAVIKGDIITKNILVESGAVFNGKCKMGQPPTETHKKNN
jgi:cytoskeletal protein CcmA (bactofilin family)